MFAVVWVMWGWWWEARGRFYAGRAKIMFYACSILILINNFSCWREGSVAIQWELETATKYRGISI
jgi:hypothetical protein